MRGARIGEFRFGFFQMGGDFAKLVDLHAGPGLDELQALLDSRAAATAFARDGGRREAVNARHAKDVDSARASFGFLGLELLNQSKGARGKVFFGVARLRCEFGKQFAWKRNAAKVERAFIGQSEIRIERKESGIGTGEELL